MNLKDLTTDELYNIAAKVYEFNGDATGTQVGYRREGFVQGVIYALGQTPQPEGVKPEDWISCETQMPKYNERVLVCSSGAGVFIAELKEKPTKREDAWVFDGDDIDRRQLTDLNYVTNWKPLPEGTLF